VFGERPQTDALPCGFSRVRGGARFGAQHSGVSGVVVSHIELQRDKPYNRLASRRDALCYPLELSAKSV